MKPKRRGWAPKGPCEEVQCLVRRALANGVVDEALREAIPKVCAAFVNAKGRPMPRESYSRYEPPLDNEEMGDIDVLIRPGFVLYLGRYPVKGPKRGFTGGAPCRVRGTNGENTVFA